MWIQKVRGGGITHLAHSPDGSTLYALDTSGQLSAWDVRSRVSRPFAQFGYNSIDWLIRELYPLADGRLVVRGQRFTLLDPTGAVLTSVDRWNPTPEQFRPDGRAYYLDPNDRRVLVRWDLATGVTAPECTIPSPKGTVPFTFQISPDGRLLVVNVLGHPRTMFELGPTGELANPTALPGAPLATSHRFSSDGRTLAVFGGSLIPVALWNVPTRTLRTSTNACHRPDRVFALHPTAPLFVGLNADEILTLFSTDSGAPIRSLDFALGRTVRCVSFSPDGLTCAVGGSNKQFAVFDVDL